MQILKSVLVVVLLSFCAFQSNASVLPVVSSFSIEMENIIDWGTHGRTLSVRVNTSDLVTVTLTNSSNEVVYQDILTESSSNYMIDLHHLPLGTYKLTATCNSGFTSGIVIIE